MTKLFSKNSFRVLQKNNGLTLTETLISVMICGIMLTLMMITHRAASGVEQVLSGRMETRDQLIRAGAMILKDLRQAGTTSISNVPNDGTWYSNTLTFYKATGLNGTSVQWDSNAVTFSLSGTTLTRTYNSTSRIIATNISRFRLYRASASADMMSVDIQASKSTNYGGSVTANYTFVAKLRY